MIVLLFLFASLSNAQSTRFFVNEIEKAKKIAAKEEKLVLLLFACGDG